MELQKQKTTMSVAEMRKILGLKKTESYWLLHKNQFQTVTVCGKIRVVIESFENWYANQIHYKKIHGEAPGREIRKDSYSISELCKLLSLEDSTVRDMIVRENLTLIKIDHHWRINKKEFYDWYKKQNHYRTKKDRERDRKAEEISMTLPEMGRLLCVDRNTAYSIVKNNFDIVEINVAGKRRVTKDSFEYWYSRQKEYIKFEDRTPDEQVQILAEHENDYLGKELRRIYGTRTKSQAEQEKKWLTTKDAAELLGISESAVIRLIRIGELKARKINRSWHILNEDIRFLLMQHHEKQEDQQNGINL